MTSDWQLSLLPERGDKTRSALHGFQSTSGEGADLADGVQAQVGQFALFHVAPDVLDRIEFGSVSGQALDHDVSIERFDVLGDYATTMGRQTIPNHQQLAADLLGQRLQEFDELRTADGASVHAEVEIPEADTGDHRQLLPIEAVLQHRCLTFRRPSLDPSGPLAQSRFVDEDDGASFATGLFFSAGQRLARHCLIATSSRWIARPAGRWLEKPRPRNTCQTLATLYFTPNSRSISLTTRAKVHSSLGKPLATAPSSRCLASRFKSFSSSAAGRPSGLRRHACASSASIRAQVIAVCRVTSHTRATSACITPRANIRMPLRRRNSSFFKSRLYCRVAIAAPRSIPTSINAHHSESVVRHLLNSQ